MRRRHAAAIVVAVLAGCSDGVQVGEPQVVESPPPTVEPEQNQAAPADFGGIAYDVPAEFKSEPPSMRLRMAQWSVPDRDGTEPPATLTLSHFGHGAGSVEDNLARWETQVVPDETSPEPGRRTLEAGGFKIHWLDLQGTYVTAMGEKHADHRVMAALIETPAGHYFFKLFGPRGTVSDWPGAFEGLLRSVREKR